jgi:hypothetical protein
VPPLVQNWKRLKAEAQIVRHGLTGLGPIGAK